jgi:hypothetical protein
MIAEIQAARSIERDRRTDIASMSVETMTLAVRVALDTTLKNG